MSEDSPSIFELIESFLEETSLDSLLIIEPVILIVGYGEFGANVVRVLNDSDPINFHPHLINVTSHSNFAEVLLPVELSFLVFRLNSLNMLSIAEEMIQHLNNISEITVTIISIPHKITSKMTTHEIIEKLKKIRANSSVFLIEEIAISDDYLNFDPRYEAEDIVIECINSILHSTVITPSGNYFCALRKFFERKSIGSLNYFTVSLEEELSDVETVFRKFMNLPLRNIKPYDIEDVLLFSNFYAGSPFYDTFFEVLTIARYISDKLELNLPPLGNPLDESMKDFMGIACFVSLRNNSSL